MADGPVVSSYRCGSVLLLTRFSLKVPEPPEPPYNECNMVNDIWVSESFVYSRQWT